MNPIRIALSGSGYKFPAHVGALIAIRDAGFTPIEYAGTSGGSLIAALAASGMPLDEMRELTLNRDWSSMLTFNPVALFSGGYCNGNNLLKFIKEKTKYKTFRDLRVDLTIVASDVASESSLVFNKYNTPDVFIGKAARASASIPLVYQPVKFGKALLMDGGIIDNIPADLLKEDSTPCLGIQLVSKQSPFNQADHSPLNVIPRLLDLMLSATENAHRSLAQKSGVQFAYIETGFAGGLDSNMSLEIRKKLMQSGYDSTKDSLKNF